MKTPRWIKMRKRSDVELPEEPPIWSGRIATILKAGLRPVCAGHESALARMGLGRPGGPREWLDRKLVGLALEETRQ
jgi:hypothetical protein